MLGDDNNEGYLESANGGTLCLIDVEELPASCQALLSDVLDKGIIDKVAGKPVTFDARVIATTTLDLQSQLSQGLFNEALYYQLAVLQIYTRPLRDHREDVPLLLNYYVDRLVEREGLSYRRFSVAAQNHLRNRNWPCLLYTSPSPRDATLSRMPSSA